jgi:hypothetical protein
METKENGNNAVKQRGNENDAALAEVRMRRQDLNPFACVGLNALALRGEGVKRVLETGFSRVGVVVEMSSYGHS